MITKLLTIGIPTYNRKNLLKDNLEKLLPSVANYWDRLEILISDNASEDGTQGLLKEFARNYPINLIFKEVNSGSADNFATLLKEARGQFVWIVSDDDIILPNAIENIIAFLKQNNSVAIVHLNNYFFRDNFDKNKVYTPRVQRIKSFCVSDKKTFIKCAGCHLTFISTLIFNKTLVDKVWNKIYEDKYFLHTAIALQCAKDVNSSLGFISFPCIAARENTKVNYNMYDVFGTHLYKVLEYAWNNCNFEKSLLKKQYVKYWRSTAKWGIIGAKVCGYKEMYSGIGNFVKLTWKIFSMVIFVYPFLMVPSFIYKLAKKIKRIFFI